MGKVRRRPRWPYWLAALAAFGLVAGFVTWWLQRQASDLAGEVLTRAAAESPPLPDIPRWPLATPASVRDGAESFAFDPDRATLVVLLHGMSASPELDPRVGSHAYARHYWGHAFVDALLGERGLRSPEGEPLTRDGWVGDAPAGDAPRDALVLQHDPSSPPLGALLLSRDASRWLGEQVTGVAQRVTAGLERFAEIAGEEPQLVLIGHSMGGLVSRQLLTNPPVDDGPFGVDTATREQVDRLRDRTLYLVTLGTPHEGSQAADRAMLLASAERIVIDEMIRPNAFARRWLLPLLQQTASYLRLEDPATEHLRTDVWAALNDPAEGLLAPHRMRRSDGSLVPVYALASRSPGGRFFVDPLVSDRIELELAWWYAEQLGLEPESYIQYTLQMLVADPTLHTLGLPERGWGSVDEHPASAEVLDRVTRVPTSRERVAFGPEGARIEIELASRVDFVRGPYAGDVPTRGPLERFWCLLVRCAEEPFTLDAGSVEDVDLADVDEPTVDVLRDLVLGREPAGETLPLGATRGRVGDGQIDADGVVPVDSALGLLMGGDDWPYLAAGRAWSVAGETLPGSWYRPDLDDPEAELPWTYLHHIDQQYDPGLARWIARTLLGTAGPDPSDPVLSRWR